jgi:hypothetical protein
MRVILYGIKISGDHSKAKISQARVTKLVDKNVSLASG